MKKWFHVKSDVPDGGEPKKMSPGSGGGPGNANYPNHGNRSGGSPKGPNVFNIMLVIFVLTFIINSFMFSRIAPSAIQIEYSQMIELVEGDRVARAQVNDELLLLTLKKDTDMDAVMAVIDPDNVWNESMPRPTTENVFTTVCMDDPQLIERFHAHGVIFSQAQSGANSSPILNFIMTWVLPIILMYFFYSFIIRRMMTRMGGSGGAGGMFGAGKSKAKEYKLDKDTGVTFADVAGQDEAKESLTEMVDFLHNPERYQAIGAKQPKGALLVGPPGTGKTLLAKAVAGEAQVPFYSISGSEFVEMFVGVGASRVRDLFEQAKKNAPCIIFIDEIDAIGKSRDNQMSQNDEREQTLNQLLSEMDGFDSSKGIIVLAATNRPEILDKALLRPGRFDRRIIVEKPDLPGREAILKVHAAKVKLGSDVDLHEIALATSGATGADLANMINEGALLAVKENRQTVAQRDLMEAVEVVIAGKEKKDRVMNPKERRMVAYHEVGHALASALEKNGQPVQKITIVPRTMGSLGYTMNMPEEERYLMTRSELMAQIVALLGGRAAEQIEFGEVSTGASNDIERATKLARGMVTQYGMSDAFGPMGLESTQNRYLDGRSVMNCSEQTGSAIDEEVRKILNQCEADAKALLENNRDALTAISETLLEKETLTGVEFMELLGKHRK